MEPNRSNDYQLPSWPPVSLNRDLWNSVLLDIALRLKAREDLEASFEELTEQGVQAALDYIQANVGPQIAILQTAVQAAQDAIEDVLEGTAPNAVKLGGQPPSFYATATALALKVDDADFDSRTRAVVAELTGNAPEALDTIYELAAAIGNDPNIRQTLLNAIALKVDKANPQMSGIATITGARPTLNFTPTESNKWLLDAFTDGTFRLVDMNAVLEVLKIAASGAMWTKQLGDVKTYIDTKAPLASPALTGMPTAPQAAVGANNSQIANMAAVRAEIAASSPVSFSAEATVAVGSTLQNNTGKPLSVSFGRTTTAAQGGQSSISVEIQVGSSSTNIARRAYDIDETYQIGIAQTRSVLATYVVPAGSFYRLNATSFGNISNTSTYAFSVN